MRNNSINKRIIISLMLTLFLLLGTVVVKNVIVNESNLVTNNIIPNNEYHNPWEE